MIESVFIHKVQFIIRRANMDIRLAIHQMRSHLTTALVMHDDDVLDVFIITPNAMSKQKKRKFFCHPVLHIFPDKKRLVQLCQFITNPMAVQLVQRKLPDNIAVSLKILRMLLPVSYDTRIKIGFHRIPEMIFVLEIRNHRRQRIVKLLRFHRIHIVFKQLRDSERMFYPESKPSKITG